MATKLIKTSILCSLIALTACGFKPSLYIPENTFFNNEIIVEKPLCIFEHAKSVSFRMGFIEKADGYNGLVLLTFAFDTKDSISYKKEIKDIKNECISYYSDDWLNMPRSGDYTYVPNYVVDFNSIDYEAVKDSSSVKITLDIYEEATGQLSYSIISEGTWDNTIINFTKFHE